MATIEITPAVLLSGLSTLTSMLVATWALSRRSRNWDQAESLQRWIEGDPRSTNLREREGLLRRVEDLEKAIDDLVKLVEGMGLVLDGVPDAEEGTIKAGIKRRVGNIEGVINGLATQIRWLRRGLGAHGSDEYTFVKSVRDSIGADPVQDADDTRPPANVVRKGLITAQNNVFEERARERESFPQIEEPPRHPALEQRRNNTRTSGAIAPRPPIPRVDPPEFDPKKRRPGG